MRALLELKRKGNHDIHFQFDMRMTYEYTAPRVVDCEAMRNGRAIHFSHKVTATTNRMGLFKVPHRTENDRAERVSDFMDDWRDQCTKIEIQR